MGLGVNIKLEKPLSRLTHLYDKKIPRALIAKSLRQAINKSVITVRKDAVERIRKIRALKTGEIKRDFTSVIRAKGSSVEDMEGFVVLSGRSMKLLRFTKGSKEPSNQKGVPIGRRRKLRIEVNPGQTKRRTDVFIIKGSGGKNVVVKRRGNQVTKTRNGVKYKGPLGGAEAAPSIGVLFKKRNVTSAIQSLAVKRLAKEFDAAYKFNLSQLTI